MYPMFKESKLVDIYQTHGPEPDIRDLALAEKYLQAWDQDPTPRVGDYVIMPNGQYHRFAYDWYDGIQTCTGGSFALGNGYVSMSGGLDPCISYDDLEITLEQRTGTFWMFHHNDWCANNGVGIKALCRVYRVI